jgi:hypothetical protein
MLLVGVCPLKFKLMLNVNALAPDARLNDTGLEIVTPNALPISALKNSWYQLPLAAINAGSA